MKWSIPTSTNQRNVAAGWFDKWADKKVEKPLSPKLFDQPNRNAPNVAALPPHRATWCVNFLKRENCHHKNTLTLTTNNWESVQTQNQNQIAMLQFWALSPGVPMLTPLLSSTVSDFRIYFFTNIYLALMRYILIVMVPYRFWWFIRKFSSMWLYQFNQIRQKTMFTFRGSQQILKYLELLVDFLIPFSEKTPLCR